MSTDAPTPLDLDAIHDDLDASDRDLKKWVRLPVKRVDAVLAEIDRLRAEVARLATRPAPAWDEDAVTNEALLLARAALAQASPSQSTPWVARLVDEVVDSTLTVVREHLPVKPDREDVARILNRIAWQTYDSMLAACPDEPSIHLIVEDSLRQADAVLALWPGRSAAEGGADR